MLRAHTSTFFSWTRWVLKNRECAMRRITYCIALVQALVLSLAGCSRASSLPVTVHSLRESLPALADAAARWRADAYLASAQISLRTEGSGMHLIDAEFNSPTEDDESLWVKLEQDGTVATEVIPHTVPVIQVEPITSEDWILDSAEALERALDEDGRRFLEEHAGTACSFLSLERDPRSPGRPVVWRLSLGECLNPEWSQDTVIDSITGEVIRRDVFGVAASPTP